MYKSLRDHIRICDCDGTHDKNKCQMITMIKTYSKMHHTDKYSQHSSIIWPIWLNDWVFVYELSGCGFESPLQSLKLQISHLFGARSFLTFRQLQSVNSLWNAYLDMIRTCSQMHRTDKYSQHSSIIWPVWLNGWVFVYELSGCGFESRCSHLNFRYRVCLEQVVPRHSGNYIL